MKKIPKSKFYRIWKDLFNGLEWWLTKLFKEFSVHLTQIKMVISLLMRMHYNCTKMLIFYTLFVVQSLSIKLNNLSNVLIFLKEMFMHNHRVNQSGIGRTIKIYLNLLQQMGMIKIN